jgi:ABC-type multidrug transport system fused ATPase/permease subunit
MIGGSAKIAEILEIAPAINTEGGNKLDDNHELTTLEVRDVRFRYPTKPDVQILKGVSFTVSSEKPRVVALCGTSGCGKSSIISLVERFYDPEEGQVLYNGHDIRELEPKWYHQQVAIVQ